MKLYLIALSILTLTALALEDTPIQDIDCFWPVECEQGEYTDYCLESWEHNFKANVCAKGIK